MASKFNYDQKWTSEMVDMCLFYVFYENKIIL